MGRNVAAAFFDAGWQTHGLARQVWRDRFDVSELSELASVDRALSKLRPELVVNAVGYGVDPSERDTRLHREINAEFPEKLVLAMGELGLRRLVHFGTALEYGAATGALDEQTKPQPMDEYGSTKLAGTRALLERARLSAVTVHVLRLFTVYGPFEHAPRLLPTLLRARLTSDAIDLSEGTQARDFTHVGDVAEGVLAVAASEAPGGIYNLATGTLTSVRAFAETAARVLSIDLERLRFGALPQRANEMAHDPVSVTKLQAATGFRARTDIAAGIRLTLERVA